MKDSVVAEVSNSADPEVPEKPRRRRFTAEYKLSIVAEAAACTEPGEVGALLRREGLYSSHLSIWRQQRDQGQLLALSPKKRGRRSTPGPSTRNVDVSSVVLDATLDSDASLLRFRLRLDGDGGARPREVVHALLDEVLPDPRFRRVQVLRREDDALVQLR